MRFFAALGLLLAPALALPADVPPDLWAAKAVDMVLSKGWLQGFPGGGFAGETPLNRYQLATTMARVLDSTKLSVPTVTTMFGDIVPNHWAAPHVQKTVAAKLMQGFPDQTFRGEQVLTRYQLAVVLAKLLDQLKVPPRSLAPTDLPAEHWAAAAVKAVTGLEVLPLGMDGRFRGDEAVNRYQLAVGLAGLERLMASRPATAEVKASNATAPLLETRPNRAQPPQKPLGLGQSFGPGQALVILDGKPYPRIALLRLSDNRTLKEFPLEASPAAIAENWALDSSAKQLYQLSAKTQIFGAIGSSNAPALPRAFGSGQSSTGGGLALNPAQEYLAVLPGSPLCVPSCDVVRFSRVLRLALLTTNPVGLYAEHLYPLDAPGNRVMGLAWPEPRNLLVLEQTATASRIYRLELNLADDLAFGPWDEAGASLELQDPSKFKAVGKELIGEVNHKASGLVVRDRLNLTVLVEGKLVEIELNKPLW
jgi:hypothetical protein